LLGSGGAGSQFCGYETRVGGGKYSEIVMANSVTFKENHNQNFSVEIVRFCTLLEE
jgi:hypothetical protein